MKSAPPPRKRLRLYSRLDARFDDRDEDPRASLVNLVDVMLVFACGLMAAVILNWNVDLSKTRVEILQREQMQELDNAEEMEQDIQSSSSFEQKGTVYEDPETGKLYVVMPKGGN